MMPPEVEVMTLEMKINLMAPASGRLRAEGRVLKAGRRISVVAADVWAADTAGKVRQVAAVQGTMTPVDRPPGCCFPAIPPAPPSPDPAPSPPPAPPPPSPCPHVSTPAPPPPSPPPPPPPT